MRNVKKEEAKEVTIVSDVDAHSQCKMRVEVKENFFYTENVRRNAHAHGFLSIALHHLFYLLHSTQNRDTTHPS
jgi:hypothetical protein